MDAKPLGEIAKQFGEIAKVLSRMSANAAKADDEGGGNTRELAAINKSLTQILAALKTIASGR